MVVAMDQSRWRSPGIEWQGRNVEKHGSRWPDTAEPKELLWPRSEAEGRIPSVEEFPGPRRRVVKQLETMGRYRR